MVYWIQAAARLQDPSNLVTRCATPLSSYHTVWSQQSWYIMCNRSNLGTCCATPVTLPHAALGPGTCSATPSRTVLGPGMWPQRPRHTLCDTSDPVICCATPAHAVRPQCPWRTYCTATAHGVQPQWPRHTPCTTRTPFHSGTHCSTPVTPAHTAWLQLPWHMLHDPCTFCVTQAHAMHHSNPNFIRIRKIVNFSTGGRTNEHFYTAVNITSFEQCPQNKSSAELVTPLYIKMQEYTHFEYLKVVDTNVKQVDLSICSIE